MISESEKFLQLLDEFPCMLTINNVNIRKTRHKELDKKLEDELKDDDDNDDETIMKYNFYTWLKIEMADDMSAREHNETAFQLTKGRNVTTLFFRIKLFLKNGENKEARIIISEIENLKKGQNVELIKSECQSEQAYAYSRLGGPDNLPRAIRLFSEVVDKHPEKFLWKFILGLAYRRAIHMEMSPSIQPMVKTKADSLRQAVLFLFQVGQEAENKVLRARAYAELAVSYGEAQRLCPTDVHQLFQGMRVSDIINKAIELAPRHAKVLSECGRTLMLKDLDRAIDLLEKSVEIRKHSVSSHHLGMCYERKASLSDQSTTRITPADSHIRTPQPPLDANNDVVKKAIDSYKKAIDISMGSNYPAISTLGCLYRKCGQYEEAIQQFNRITNSTENADTNVDYLYSVISAYENAGFCYIELSQDNEAENCLLRAVSIAAELASRDPDVARYSSDVWQAMKTLESGYMLENSPKSIKKLIDLFSTVHQYERVPPAIEKLRALSEDGLSDPAVVTAGVESLLALRQCESAFTFLNLKKVFDSKSSDLNLSELETKVLLHTAASRLQEVKGDARLLLRKLLQSYISHATDSDAPTGETPAVSDAAEGAHKDKEKERPEVMFYYDDSSDAEKNISRATKDAQLLKRLINDVYGVNTALNLQGCQDFGEHYEILINELCATRLVIILLDEESAGGNGLFQKVLIDFTLRLHERQEPLPKVKVLSRQADCLHNTPSLASYPTFPLGDLMENINNYLHRLKIETSELPNGTDDQSQDVRAILTLFCWIVEQKCPIEF